MGIEEEYLLVDCTTRDLASDPPPELLAQCEDRLGGRVTAEFMRSQIEVGTRVCNSIGEARGELQELRGTVAEVAGQFGLAPIAASTHPFAHWSQQSHTDKERYDDLANALQATARRLLISGMHVHVAIEPEDMRIDLMNLNPEEMCLGDPDKVCAMRAMFLSDVRQSIPKTPHHQ